MPKLKTYDVVYNGQRTTMKLTEESAKRLGATEVTSSPEPTKAPAKKAATKKRTSKNKAADNESG